MNTLVMPITSFLHEYPNFAHHSGFAQLSADTQVLYVPAHTIISDVVYVQSGGDLCVIVGEYAQVKIMFDQMEIRKPVRPELDEGYEREIQKINNSQKTENSLEYAVRYGGGPMPTILSGSPRTDLTDVASSSFKKDDEVRRSLIKTTELFDKAKTEGCERENQKNSKIIRLYAHQNAAIAYTTVYTGSGNQDIELWLLGKNAHISVYGIYGITGTDTYYITTKQEHSVPGATSSVLIKGIVGGHAVSEYSGVITIGEQAPQSNANQQAAALLLSPQARSRSIPSLQVLTNDVRCKHGSAVGQLNKDQLFYAQARGLSQTQAEQLLMHGFLAQAITHIPADQAGEIIERLTTLF